MFDPPCAQRLLLDELVEQLLERVGIDAPPVDAFAIAERLDLEICLDRQQQTRGRLAQTGRQLTIFMQPEPRTERQQWTVAHEIGEKLLGQAEHAARLGIDDCFAPEREMWASEFASHLLIPTAWWEFDARVCGYDLLELKSRYLTASHELLAKRMLDLDPPTIVTVFDQGKTTRRWMNWAGRVPGVFAVESRVRESANRTGLAVKEQDGGLTVQGWAIHEPGWEREILRTVYEGYEE